MAAHRYWRVRSASTNDGTYFALSEAELRSSIGGPDQTGSGTALSGGNFNTGSNPPSNVFDNSTSTWWASQSGGAVNGWIGYDFGSAISIVEVSLTARNDSSYTQAPSSGSIEYSDDGSLWIPVYDFSGLTWTTGSSNVITIPAAPTSNVRVSETALEVLNDGQANAVISNFSLEVLHDGTANALVSGVSLEVLHDGTANAIVSGIYLEVLHSTAVASPANGALSLTLAPLTLNSHPYHPIIGYANNLSLGTLTLNSNSVYTDISGSKVIFVQPYSNSQIQIMDSGYGYFDNTSVTVFGSDANAIPATGIIYKGAVGREKGYYKNTKGFTSDSQHIFDGSYYQDFSYEVRSSLSFEKYSSILKKVLHPAGMNMFGSIDIRSENILEVSVNSNIVQITDLNDGILELNNYDIVHAGTAIIISGTGGTVLPWILATGSWNDLGIWDDTASWLDS